jgi:hypothetical protein
MKSPLCAAIPWLTVAMLNSMRLLRDLGMSFDLCLPAAAREEGCGWPSGVREHGS